MSNPNQPSPTAMTPEAREELALRLAGECAQRVTLHDEVCPADEPCICAQPQRMKKAESRMLPTIRRLLREALAAPQEAPKIDADTLRERWANQIQRGGNYISVRREDAIQVLRVLPQTRDT